jgi:FAD dependent oxidoreductase
MDEGDPTPRWYEGDGERDASGGWFVEGEAQPDRVARPSAATYAEPARELPVHCETDVLVVGGGPSGCAAATAAGRLGADVLLVERYGHLGGLATGGLVFWIDRMTDWAGRQVITGYASTSSTGCRPIPSSVRRRSSGARRIPQMSRTGSRGRARFATSSPGRRQSIRSG